MLIGNAALRHNFSLAAGELLVEPLDQLQHFREGNLEGRVGVRRFGDGSLVSLLQAGELPREGEVGRVVGFASRQLVCSRGLLVDELAVLALPLLDCLLEL